MPVLPQAPEKVDVGADVFVSRGAFPESPPQLPFCNFAAVTLDRPKNTVSAYVQMNNNSLRHLYFTP